MYIYLQYCEEVIRIPSLPTRAPTMLSNCSIRVLTDFPSQTNCSSDCLRDPGGQTGTWEVRGVTIIRSKEESKKVRDAGHKDWTQMDLTGPSHSTWSWQKIGVMPTISFVLSSAHRKNSTGWPIRTEWHHWSQLEYHQAWNKQLIVFVGDHIMSYVHGRIFPHSVTQMI